MGTVESSRADSLPLKHVIAGKDPIQDAPIFTAQSVVKSRHD